MHDSDSLPVDRRRQIAGRLGAGQSVVAASLAREFNISEDAIRRDLRALAAEGLCKRVYGGALPLSPANTPMTARAGQDVTRKRALAVAAGTLIGEGQTLFLDAGSTVLQLAQDLPVRAGLRVVTNSIPAAAALAHRSDLSLFVVGGAVSPDIGACVDGRALGELDRYRIDVCFLGACALSPEEGLSGFDMADVEIKRTLLARSRATVLMMTNEKLGTFAPFPIGRVDTLAHLVVEHDAPRAMVQALGLGRRTLTAGPPAVRDTSR